MADHSMPAIIQPAHAQHQHQHQPHPAHPSPQPPQPHRTHQPSSKGVASVLATLSKDEEAQLMNGGDSSLRNNTGGVIYTSVPQLHHTTVLTSSSIAPPAPGTLNTQNATPMVAIDALPEYVEDSPKQKGGNKGATYLQAIDSERYEVFKRIAEQCVTDNCVPAQTSAWRSLPRGWRQQFSEHNFVNRIHYVNGKEEGQMLFSQKARKYVVHKDAIKAFIDREHKLFHEGRLGAEYCGVKKQYDRIKSKYIGIPRSAVEECIASCEICARNRPSPKQSCPPIAASLPPPQPQRQPMQEWELAIMNLANVSSVINFYIMVAVDTLSQFVWAEIISSREPSSLIEGFCAMVWSGPTGYPAKIVAGPAFSVPEFKSILDERQVAFELKAEADPPIAMSTAERLSLLLCDNFHKYSSGLDNQTSVALQSFAWAQQLRSLVFMCNGSWNGMLSATPFRMHTGRDAGIVDTDALIRDTTSAPPMIPGGVLGTLNDSLSVGDKRSIPESGMAVSEMKRKKLSDN